MDYKMYCKRMKEMTMDGFESGYSFDEFKKGDVIGTFERNTKDDELVWVEGTVVQIVKAKNAEGKDTIRQIVMKYNDKNQERQFSGHQQIKNFIFKAVAVATPEPKVKDEVKEEPKQEAPKKAAKKSTKMEDKVEVSEDGRTLIVKGGMTEKNPVVKKYIAMGWVFEGSEWSTDRNMYLGRMSAS